jgi:hypothetical protein
MKAKNRMKMTRNLSILSLIFLISLVKFNVYISCILHNDEIVTEHTSPISPTSTSTSTATATESSNQIQSDQGRQIETAPSSLIPTHETKISESVNKLVPTDSTESNPILQDKDSDKSQLLAKKSGEENTPQTQPNQKTENAERGEANKVEQATSEQDIAPAKIVEDAQSKVSGVDSPKTTPTTENNEKSVSMSEERPAGETKKEVESPEALVKPEYEI